MYALCSAHKYGAYNYSLARVHKHVKVLIDKHAQNNLIISTVKSLTAFFNAYEMIILDTHFIFSSSPRN